MQFETRVTWEKLLIEIRNLQPDDDNAIIPLLVGTQAALAPKEAVEGCFRQVHFLGFELQQATQDLLEVDRWIHLRQWFFAAGQFRALNVGGREIQEEDLLFKPILQKRAGHPLPLALLFLHLAGQIELPVSLLQAGQSYIVKYACGGSGGYLDISRSGHVLNDAEVFQVLQKSSGTETRDARSTYRRYLEHLMQVYEQLGQSHTLHSIYNICLHLDEANLPVLSRRAILRHRLGFAKEALVDLKRYFSFVDRNHAPIELQKIMIDLEGLGDEPGREASSEMLH